MAGSIADFKASFNTDLARSNKFDVLIYPPAMLLANIPATKASQLMKYRCEVSQLPGRTLATTERKTYGPIQKLPYLSTYNDVDLTFMIDDDMRLKKYFDTWIEMVNPKNTNNFNYLQDYSSSIIITQYGVDNNPTYFAELVQAYPVSMNQMDLDWSSDSVHKLTVTFAYTYWNNNSFINLLS